MGLRYNKRFDVDPTQLEIDNIEAQSALGESDMSSGDAMRQRSIASDQSQLAQLSNNATQASELSQIAGSPQVSAASKAAPYIAGAGLALQTVGQIDQAKRQQEQAAIDAYNNKIMAQRSAIKNLFA